MEHFNHALKHYGYALITYAKDRSTINEQKVIVWKNELDRLANLIARKVI
jgi:hypothetical protein